MVLNGVMNTKVYPITFSEVDQAAETLFLAFHKDALMTWLMGGEDNYQSNAKPLIATWITYCIRYGIAIRTEGFEAVALRRKPGDIKFTFWRMLRSGMLKTPKYLDKAGMKRLEIMDQLVRSLKQESMDRGSFVHCWVMGTRPDKQRQGYGRLLMNYTFDWARKLGLPCCLETVTQSTAEQTHENVGYQLLKSAPLADSGLQLSIMKYIP